MSSKRWSTLIKCSLAFSRENVNVAGTSASASSLGISAATAGRGWVGVIVGAWIPDAPLRALFLTLPSGFSDRSSTAFLFTAATGASYPLLLPEEDFPSILVASLAEVRIVGIMSWQQSYKTVRRERGFLWRPIQCNLALSCNALTIFSSWTLAIQWGHMFKTKSRSPLGQRRSPLGQSQSPLGHMDYFLPDPPRKCHPIHSSHVIRSDFSKSWVCSTIHLAWL